MTFHLSEAALARIRLGFALVLVVAFSLFVWLTIKWQLIFDPSIMHYVNMLTAHGLVPYRDIVDINLPGAFFMDHWAMMVFGGGDLAWRIYDFFLLAVLTGAMVVIAWPYDWFAGMCAGVVFTLKHAAEGARNAGQREEIMVVLILVGYACLFQGLRRRLPLLLLPFGMAIGLAASLKPTAALLVVLLPCLVAMALRRDGARFLPFVSYSLLGFCGALLVNAWFFWSYGNFHDFVTVSRRLVSYYASIGNNSGPQLVKALLSGLFIQFSLLSGTALTILNRERDSQRRLERNLLLVGALFGAVSYLAQRKVFEHHMYAFVAFILLWAMIEAGKAWRGTGWRRVAGLAIFSVFMFWMVPKYVYLLRGVPAQDQQQMVLRDDLTRLGGDSLQHQVLCFDIVSSCYSTLYHMQLLPYSNIVADYMLLPPIGSQPARYYREMLWHELQHSPPKVIVVTDSWFGEERSFHNVEQWPELGAYLGAQYSLAVERDSDYSSYRLYVRAHL